MTPIDPTVKAGSKALEHWETLARVLTPIVIAALVFSFFMIKELMRVKTWRGRLVVYVGKLSVGACTAYVVLLALPKLHLDVSASGEQLAAFISFYIGKDFIEVVARRLFGLKTRGDDKRGQGGDVA